MDWPANLLDPSYGPMVTSAVTQQEAEIAWAPVTVAQAGHSITFLFSARPLRVGGVFVNVSATTQQQCADALGALLPTPKMVDLAYAARAKTILPVTMPVASTSAAMLDVSAKLDAVMGSTEGALPCQKTWCLSNSLTTAKACNYGFLLPKGTRSPWEGIACYPSVTLTATVIQQPGTAHDPSHVDYSQVCMLVHRSCTIDGVDGDLAAALTDSSIAPLLSHEGAITIPNLRQPGVAQFACASPGAIATASMRPFVATSAPGLCPMPKRPGNIEEGASFFERAWPWAAGATVAGAIGVWWARHRGWLPLRST